jgi:voltage-gated potassium channel
MIYSQRLRSVLDMAVVVGALATIPLTVLQEHGASSRALDALDWGVWGIFAIELLLLTSFAPRSEFLRASTAVKLIVVLLSFPLLPSLLALVRLARLGRLLRLMRLTGVTVRGITAIRKILGRRGLIYVAVVTSLLILVGGGCLSILEPQTVKGGGYGDGVWWAVVTATTVGYGDISPSTLPGRIIAVLLMLVGIGLMSTLAAAITSYFVQQTANTELKDLTARLDRIESILGQLAREQARYNQGFPNASAVMVSNGFPVPPSVRFEVTDG